MTVMGLLSITCYIQTPAQKGASVKGHVYNIVRLQNQLSAVQTKTVAGR